jgi:thiol:disulfide interchange protein DsbC
MYRKIHAWLAGGSLVLFSLGALASPDDAIRKRLAEVLPGQQVTSIHQTPVPGIYEVLIGTDLLYVSEDGRYMLQGRLIDLEQRENLTETSPRLAEALKRAAKERAAAVEKVGDDNMVVFSPKRYDHTVTVFTDIDCVYCRKLHSEIDSYLDAGIRVRYLFYPRAGAGSPSFNKAVSVWCADDRQKAMTDAKAGRSVDNRKCENPVASHVHLGEELGINGTPAIVLDTGELVPGYVPAKRLSGLLRANGD